MKKNLFYAVVAIGMLASCVDNEYVGEVTPNPNPGNGTESAIVFSSGTKAVTRAGDITGSTAAGLLNNNFVFAGTKGTQATTYVFDQYTAKYVENTANSTESNTHDWEYVGQSLAPTTSLPSGATQTIKYWDYTATQYDFAAYSFGKGDESGQTPTFAVAKDNNNANSPIAAGDKSYSLTGTVEELKACYISDLVTAYNQSGVCDYGNVVEFKFRSLATKIRIALFETVPGYSVGDVMFYPSAANDAVATTTPTLFASSAVLPSGSGTMTVTFPTTGWGNRNATDYNKAHVEFAQASGTTGASTLTFDALANYANPESKEVLATAPAVPTTGFLGRSSKDATYAGGLVDADNDDSTPETGKYYTILPNEDGANLTLRIKYTLLSTDGSTESITVDNATAVIPAQLAQWNPNYAYTYIFKISDMTNGTTGVDKSTNKPVMGLTPITLNAVVVDSEDGVQETITTVSNPSITTYAKGEVVTKNDEYVASVPIYIIVNDGTENVVLTNKANLYTVTLAKSTDTGDNPEDNASQPISEESVANAFANGTKDDNDNPTTWTVKDANKWKMVLTKSDLSIVNVIDAADSPTGNEISIGTAMVGKFTPAAGTNYVFQYEVEPGEEAGTYDATSAAAYNATLPGAITTDDIAYTFTSYASDKITQHGTGMVKVVPTEEAGWMTVVVISNNPIDSEAADFVGQQFKIKTTPVETYYELYTTGGDATGVFVTVAESTTTEINTYNATLTGHVSVGDPKPAVPGKYQYKIIKVAE